MKLLVKLGGTLLDDSALRASLAQQLVGLAREHAVTVVHGGGKQMTQFLAARGVESRFVDGLRVTTPEVIDALLKVIAGTVNHELVATLNAAGARAVGLSGIDAGIAEAVPLRADLGAVGRVTQARGDLLSLLAENAYLPVVACVAGDPMGIIYNVNADQMAVACAGAFAADRLLFLTDVDGVRQADGTIAPQLTDAEAQALIQAGVATGGMQAKLNAAGHALAEGVGEVVIAPGAAPKILTRLLAGEASGTRLVKE